MTTRNIVPRANDEGGIGTTSKKWANIWATLVNALTLTAQSVGFTIAGGTTSKTLTVENTSLVNQDLTTDASPIFVTAKLSALTDNYVPKHTSDAAGLANSNIYAGTNNIGIGTSAPANLLALVGATAQAIEIKNTTAIDVGTVLGSIYFTGGSPDYSDAIESANPGAIIAAVGDMLWHSHLPTSLVFKTVADGSASALERMRITGTGLVGIATAAPASPLAVNRQADDGVIIDLEQADTVEGTISVSGNTVSYNAFVGSHYTQLKAGQDRPPVGAVVISTGEIIPCEVTKEKTEETVEEIPIEEAYEDVVIPASHEETAMKYEIINGAVVQKIVVTKPATEEVTKTQLKRGVVFDENDGVFRKTTATTTTTTKTITTKEYFPYVNTTSTPADKSVYGVWLGKMKDNAEGQSFGKNNKPIYLVAQVGLFKIRATDTNGNIANGDFLETSSRPNEAQKQTADRKLNSTVAKAMVSVDWALETVDPKLGYKWKLIPCIF